MALRLRPHHIVALTALKQGSPLYRALFSAIVRTMYGRETYRDYRKVVQKARAGEEISITMGIGDLCTNCPYKEPCNSGEYTKGTEMVPRFFRTIGAVLSNTRDEDEKALNRLGLDQTQTYTLDQLMSK